MREIKKVKLIGLGAMGCFFAPKLEKALGEGFKIIATGDRRKRLENDGVTINGINYKFDIADPGDEKSEQDTELIIIAVKGYSLEQALKDIRPFVGEDTLIMSVINGVDSEEKVKEAYGEKHVIYSYMRVSIVMKDGVTNFNPEVGKVHFGDIRNIPGNYSENVVCIAKLFEDAHINYNIDEDMLRGIWFKFSCNVGENMTCAMLGIPFGSFHQGKYANEIREQGMREVIAIANKMGIDLSEDDVIRQRDTLMGLPFENKPSTLQDLEAGKLTEVDMFAGEVIRLGRKYGVPTPMSEIYYRGIRAKEEVILSRQKMLNDR